jgi:Predicted ATPase
VLGGYAATGRIEMFLHTRDERPGQATREEVALPGARVLIATEPDPGDVLSAKKIKSMTGGDQRPARALNCPMFYYRPTAVPILSFNRTPRIKGEDEGLWRRLEFVLFGVELHKLPDGQRRDAEEVRAELREEGAGILNWLLEGFAAARALGGLHPPPAVRRVKDDLRGASDPVGEFFADCVEEADGNLPISEAFAAFQAYCEKNGLAEVHRARFGRVIAEKGLAETGKSGSVRHLKGRR